MNTRYIFGIIITVVLLSVNQAFIQYWLAQKKHDANTINIAGKQRMLSQRINAEFYRLEKESASPHLLKKLVAEWKTSHFKLQSKDKSNKLVPITNSEIRLALKELNPNIEFIESQLNNIGKASLNLSLINQNQNSFLPKMDKIVKSLEKISDKKLQFIIKTEFFLFFMSLIILILEVVFIYIPIEKSLNLANAEISKKNEDLKQALTSIGKKNRELEQITYITSHDLQEPVRTINSLVNIFKIKYARDFDEEGIKMLRYLDTATVRMRDLIKDLLDYSIIGKKREKTKIDCAEILEIISKDLALKINETKAKITWGRLPKILGIEAEIRLLFQNLISNALKFQMKGHQPKIDIAAIEKKDFWLFTVSDNGIGIESKNVEKIFSIFHRIHSKDKFEGTGIGLAHCAKVVDIHGGAIWVESELGKGCTFFFTIKKDQNKIVGYEQQTELYITS